MKAGKIISYLAVLIFFSAMQAQGVKVAVVLSRSLAPYQAALRGFSEKASFELVTFNMEGNEAKGSEILDAIASGGFSAVVVIGSEATNAVKDFTKLPVVYTMLLEKPNLSGSRTTGILLDVKVEDKVRFIKQLFPGVVKIGVIYNTEKTRKIINQARQAMSNAGLNLIPLAITSQDEYKLALSKLTKDSVDLIWSVPDPFSLQPEAVKATIAQALEQKIPFIAMSEPHVTAGALAAFSVNFTDLGAQTLDLTMDTLEGKNVPAVNYPKHMILYVNADTLSKLGLSNFHDTSEIIIIKK